ncbi:threonine dehydratase [Arthrobacter sp. UYCu712]
MITRGDVLEAESRISGQVRRTPLLRAGTSAAPLWFKCEFLQHTGVFKARGAFNRLLAARERGELDPGAGLVAASGGNAGLANAYAAAVLGVPATVFVPEAYAAAMDYVEASGALFCHAYDQLEIAAGAGTVAEEILQDEPGIDTIIVAVGGGGLYAGVGAASEGRARGRG